MCKTGGLLVAFDVVTQRALVTDADCGSWLCIECKDRMRAAWMRRVQHGVTVFHDNGVPVYFATITSHEKNKTFNACAEVWPDAWKKLHKKLNRTSETKEYVLIPEKHVDGRLHVHAIWTFNVNTRWIKDNGRECGLGFMSQIGRKGHKDEPIEDASKVSQYVAKYLGKQLGNELPPRFRRVRASQRWPDAPEPVTTESVLKWQHIGTNGELNRIYDRCTAEHMTMMDMRTGEIFDDVDLGTIVSIL
jgi:hypothetical protein